MKNSRKNTSVYLRLANIAIVGTICIFFASLTSQVGLVLAFEEIYYRAGGVLFRSMQIAFVIVCVAFAIYMFRQIRRSVSHQQARGSTVRHRRRRLRKEDAIYKQQKSLEAQLCKPDFESRLQKFTRRPKSEEPFVSKAKFWQLETEHHRSRPRDLSHFRKLLMRIAKLVNKSKMT